MPISSDIAIVDSDNWLNVTKFINTYFLSGTVAISILQALRDTIFFNIMSWFSCVSKINNNILAKLEAYRAVHFIKSSVGLI